jgi:tRNA A37 threonylcarbamoyladenosine biosynthesis protein TsaE
MHVYGEQLLHIDMYRVDSEQLLHNRGLLDAIDTHSHVVIEWPRYTDLYADDTWTHISIVRGERESRIVAVGT